ncbi:MAG: hypothetical protein JO060_03945, partial [Candidatus Eremiobacteraeota bacterium]|nr:hypothetical protein [Candidatus Eremiobacteraeota bacterium]
FVAVPPWWRTFAIFAIALFFQATVLHDVQVRGVTVSFAFLVVLWYAVSAGGLRAAFFGLVAGACEDGFSGASGAAWTIATPLAAALAGELVSATGWDHPAFLGLVAFVASFVRTVAFWIVLRAFGASGNTAPTPDLRMALLSAAAMGAVALVVMAFFSRLRPLRVGPR